MDDGRLSLAAIDVPGSDGSNPFLLNMENGRLYLAEYGNREYMLPCDEEERRRLDLLHAFFKAARRTNLFSAPIEINAPGCRVLDVGCGTGIWSIELAGKYPHVDFVGIDLAQIQPRDTRRNLTFVAPVDIESDASYRPPPPRGTNRQTSPIKGWHEAVGPGPSWDLIHLRTLKGAVADWPSLYSRIHSSLRPGKGWIEQVEIDFVPRCDDRTLPQNSALFDWADKVITAFEMAGTSLRIDPNGITAQLIGAGFVDVKQEVFVVPFNSWPEQNEPREVGRWFNVAMTEGTLSSYAMKPLTKFSGWQKDRIFNLVNNAKSEVVARRHHAYCLLFAWVGRRP